MTFRRLRVSLSNVKCEEINISVYTEMRVRRSGLMVCALQSGASGPGSSPGWGTLCCVLERKETLTVPLSTQVYKWVPANLMLGVTPPWTSIPSRGE